MHPGPEDESGPSSGPAAQFQSETPHADRHVRHDLPHRPDTGPKRAHPAEHPRRARGHRNKPHGNTRTAHPDPKPATKERQSSPPTNKPPPEATHHHEGCRTRAATPAGRLAVTVVGSQAQQVLEEAAVVVRLTQADKRGSCPPRCAVPRRLSEPHATMNGPTAPPHRGKPSMPGIRSRTRSHGASAPSHPRFLACTAGTALFAATGPTDSASAATTTIHRRSAYAASVASDIPHAVGVRCGPGTGCAAGRHRVGAVRELLQHAVRSAFLGRCVTDGSSFGGFGSRRVMSAP